MLLIRGGLHYIDEINPTNISGPLIDEPLTECFRVSILRSNRSGARTIDCICGVHFELKSSRMPSSHAELPALRGVAYSRMAGRQGKAGDGAKWSCGVSADGAGGVVVPRAGGWQCTARRCIRALFLSHRLWRRIEFIPGGFASNKAGEGIGDAGIFTLEHASARACSTFVELEILLPCPRESCGQAEGQCSATGLIPESRSFRYRHGASPYRSHCKLYQ